jgi:hypothetical protein
MIHNTISAASGTSTRHVASGQSGAVTPSVTSPKAGRTGRHVEQLLAVLGTPDSEFLTLLNSWGRDYPHRVRINKAIVQRLLDEDGEATLVTDR